MATSGAEHDSHFSGHLSCSQAVAVVYAVVVDIHTSNHIVLGCVRYAIDTGCS